MLGRYYNVDGKLRFHIRWEWPFMSKEKCEEGRERLRCNINQFHRGRADWAKSSLKFDKEKCFYRGKDINEMSREELLIALLDTAKRLYNMYSPRGEIINILNSLQRGNDV